MGCVAPAVPSKLSWVPRHCQKNGVKSPLFCCFFCVVGYLPNWGKRPRYIDRIFVLLPHSVVRTNKQGQFIAIWQKAVYVSETIPLHR